MEAFPTSPLLSLLSEVGVSPLCYMREILILKYATYVWSFKIHLNFKLYFEYRLAKAYEIFKIYSQPAGIRVAESMIKYNIVLLLVLDITKTKIPRLLISEVMVRTDLSKNTRECIYLDAFSYRSE